MHSRGPSHEGLSKSNQKTLHMGGDRVVIVHANRGSVLVSPPAGNIYLTSSSWDVSIA